MENDEIIESYFYDDDLDHSYIDAEDFQSLMDKARQDEREKIQGVEGIENFYCADWNRCGTTCEEQCPSCKKPDRLDEMQGVEVYISWDDNDFTHNIKVACDMEPKKNVKENGSVYYTLHDVNCYFPKNLAEYIGLKKGQCKKVRIVEVLP